MTRLIDSHCHLDFEGLSDRLPEVLDAMDGNGIAGCMTIGVTLEEAPQVLAIAHAYPQVFASVGVHPEYADHREPDVGTLCELANDPKVLAIGETGLDYHWHKDRPEWQRERFRVHIRAARELNKPLVIHTRESAEDTLAILREEGAEAVGGILHCFTESLAVARARHKLQAEAVDWFLPHMSSEYFRQPLADYMAANGFAIAQEKWFTNLQTKGNTGSASIFIILDELLRSGRLALGNRLLCFVPESGRFTGSLMHLTAVEHAG